jgi:hypothetical protein
MEKVSIDYSSPETRQVAVEQAEAMAAARVVRRIATVCRIFGWALIVLNLLAVTSNLVVSAMFAAQRNPLALMSVVIFQLLLPSVIGFLCIALGAGLRMLASIGMSLREIAGRR